MSDARGSKVDKEAVTMKDDKVGRRFIELSEQALKMSVSQLATGQRRVDISQLHAWATSAMSLIGAVFGEGSPQYRNFLAAYTMPIAHAEQAFQRQKGVFLGAKADFDGGYLFNIERTLAGEIVGDFVLLARRALEDGQKDVAAVLACAALEDALKRYAGLHELDVQDKDMSEVIAALGSRGLIEGAQKKLLGAMPKIRNSAFHAQWGKIELTEVATVLVFVEQFIVAKLS